MLLWELFTQDELNKELTEGRVSLREHVEFSDVAVLNYTPKAQYEGHTPVTTLCRGLVFDQSNGELLGKPLPKFYNYGESAAPKFDLSEPVSVFDKADGSLIVAFWYGDDFLCCSRGSFNSEQALAAQKMLDDVDFDWKRGITYLFELVGPSNPIVLKYPEDKLISLGAVETEKTQYIFPGRIETPFEAVEEFQFDTFADALAAPPRPNAEGYIIHGLPGTVKLKQQDYIELHRIIFNLTPKNIWRAIVAGKTLDQIKEPFPDEFYDEIDGHFNSIYDAYGTIADELMRAYSSIPPTADRKAFAAQVKKHPRHLQGLLFAVKDMKPTFETIMRMVEPKGDKPRVEGE